MKFISYGPGETADFGQKLAAFLRAGDCLCLFGDLGAGKTLLVQGIAAGLGVESDVTSPTFTVLNVYDAPVPVYHFDLYRLNYQEELFDIGFDEYATGEGIALVEWPDKFLDAMPESRLDLKLTRGDNDDERTITIIAHGSRYQELIEELKQRCS